MTGADWSFFRYILRNYSTHVLEFALSVEGRRVDASLSYCLYNTVCIRLLPSIIYLLMYLKCNVDLAESRSVILSDHADLSHQHLVLRDHPIIPVEYFRKGFITETNHGVIVGNKLGVIPLGDKICSESHGPTMFHTFLHQKH